MMPRTESRAGRTSNCPCTELVTITNGFRNQSAKTANPAFSPFLCFTKWYSAMAMTRSARIRGIFIARLKAGDVT